MPTSCPPYLASPPHSSSSANNDGDGKVATKTSKNYIMAAKKSTKPSVSGQGNGRSHCRKPYQGCNLKNEKGSSKNEKKSNVTVNGNELKKQEMAKDVIAVTDAIKNHKENVELKENVKIVCIFGYYHF